MTRKNINKACEEEQIYTCDYSKNVSVRDKEASTPKVYTINFFHDFDDDATLYKPYFDVFEKAKSNDEIIIYFNSIGGCITTLNLFLNAIKASKCRNVTARVNYAASAAALLVLACDKIIFNDNSTLMLHTFNTLELGKEQEVSASLEHTKQWANRITDKYYGKILSKEELKELHNGKDFYFDENEAIKRLKKYGKGK